MLHGEFKRDMRGNYLVLERGKQGGETYELKMLLNNQPEGMLRLELRRTDDQIFYYFDITSMQPLNRVLEKESISGTWLFSMVENIIRTMEGAGEFLLKEKNFVLEPEYIFAEQPGLALKLCYVPGYGKPARDQMTKFLEYLMEHIDYKDERAVCLLYGLYQRSRKEDCTFLELLSFMEEERKTEPPEMKKREPPKTGEHSQEKRGVPAIAKRVEGEEEVSEPSLKKCFLCGAAILFNILFLYGGLRLQAGFPAAGKWKLLPAALLFLLAAADVVFIKQILKYSFREPVIKTKVEYLDPDQESVLLDPEREEVTEILYEKGETGGYRLKALNQEQYEDIILTGFPFFIGKLRQKVDYAIQNRTVSRFHAKLEERGGEIFLVDLNSTNGTYKNHERLEPNGMARVIPGDVISFAGVSYRFTGAVKDKDRLFDS